MLNGRRTSLVFDAHLIAKLDGATDIRSARLVRRQGLGQMEKTRSRLRVQAVWLSLLHRDNDKFVG